MDSFSKFLFIFSSFAALGVFWFVWQYKKEKRSLKLGISFIVALLTLLALFGFLLIQIPDAWFTKKILLIGGVLFVSIMILFPVVLVVVMITSGINLIRREGGGLSHILSLGFGIFYILYLIIWPMMNGIFNTGFFDFLYIYLSFCFTFTIYIFVLYTITSMINSLKNTRKKYKYIIVLGSGLRNGVEVTPLLASRVDKGIEAYRENQGSILVLSGGKGEDEKIAEGEAMRNYALKQKVPETDIVIEDKSTTTRENLLFSKELIDNCEEKGDILVVTTRYHVLRALLLAKNLGIECDGRGSKTKFYFSINAFVREWIAYLVLWRKKYFLVLAGGFVVIALGYLLKIFLNI